MKTACSESEKQGEMEKYSNSRDEKRAERYGEERELHWQECLLCAVGHLHKDTSDLHSLGKQVNP